MIGIVRNYYWNLWSNFEIIKYDDLMEAQLLLNLAKAFDDELLILVFGCLGIIVSGIIWK